MTTSDNRRGQGSLAAKIVREHERHLDILAEAGVRIEAEIKCIEGAPDRDLCRAINTHRAGLMAAFEIEKQKTELRIAAAKNGFLPDEDIEAEMLALAIDTVRSLPADKLQPLIAERGWRVEQEDLSDD